MRTIIFEQEIFKVSEKEFKILKSLEKKVKDTFHDYKACFAAEDDLHNYLDNNKSKYKLVGVVDFHAQR